MASSEILILIALVFVGVDSQTTWDCDFEKDMCQWKAVSDSSTTSQWTRKQAKSYLTPPTVDHTRGPSGDGYYMTAPNGLAELRTATALSANTQYCLSFWLYKYGSSMHDFTVQTLDSSSTDVLFVQDSLGASWQEMIVSLPVYKTAFNLQFSSEIKGTGTNNFGLDDVRITDGDCPKQAGPNCTFARGTCGWKGSDNGDFSFDVGPGSDGNQNKEAVHIDHTTHTSIGFLVKASADGHSEGQKAHYQSSPLPFNSTVCLRFYYFLTSSCDSILTVETQGPQDRQPVSLWGRPNLVHGFWQLGEVTIFYPANTLVLFTVSVGHKQMGEVGIDDVNFVGGECPYKGATDFEHGFDVYHNVYSNDFDWVIARPRDGIFPWLPDKDYSTGTAHGHFAVATYDAAGLVGKKAELWSPLAPDSTSQCTYFSLYVHGSDPGTLNVTLVDHLEQNRVVVWSYSPPLNLRDVQLHCQFPHVMPGRSYIVFTVIMGGDGGWAIDNIDTLPSTGVCRVVPPPAAAVIISPPTSLPSTTARPFLHQANYECDFEKDFCLWNMDVNTDVNWLREDSDLSTQYGPKAGRPGGGLFYLTLGDNQKGKVAVLRSPDFNTKPGNSYTFRFWLFINGPQPGAFTVAYHAPSLSTIVYYRNTLTFTGKRGSEKQDSVCIDDIQVSDAPDRDDNNLYRCSFELADLCGFTEASPDNLNWAWHGGNDGVLQYDHTFLSEWGHAMMISHTSGKPGDVARLTTKSVPPMSGCLTAWLLMQSDGAALRVYINRQQQQELLAHKRQNQGEMWSPVEVTFSSHDPFTITLELEILGSRITDILLDDFALTQGSCSTQGACRFERDLCTWDNRLAGDDFDWIWGSGNTVSVAAPGMDTTIEAPEGHYIYAEANTPRHYGDKAWFMSEAFPPGLQCIHFQFHMRGAYIGTLNIYTDFLGTGPSRPANLTFSLSGGQGNDWQTGMATVGASDVNYKVRFEVILGYSVTNDIALDDITFLPEACKTLPPAAEVTSVGQQTSTTLPTSAPPASASVTCKFDDVSLCGFQSDSTAPNSWVISSSNMASSDTLKPFQEHTHSDPSKGFFIYPQVNNNGAAGDAARIISPAYPANSGSPQCLEFYYHMSGSQLGQLNVYIAPDGSEGALGPDMMQWSLRSDSGPSWRKARVPINQSGKFHVVFENIRGAVDHYYGIDDLSIRPAPCGPSEICNFGNADTCLWTLTGAEDTGFYWNPYQAWTRTADLAPPVDHTNDSVTGWYMLVEANTNNTGKQARLYSQVFPGSSGGAFCFSFWYFMFGRDLGKMKVFVRNNLATKSSYGDADLWELDGPTDDGWHQAQVNISKKYTQNPFMIVVEATVGQTTRGGFAIDDTKFEKIECDTIPGAAKITASALMLPDCTFDDGTMCGWVAVDFGDKQFVIGDSSLVADHTTGSGGYLFTDSTKIFNKETASALSPLLPPTMGVSCFSLWFKMTHTGGSELNVAMVSGAATTPLWRAYTEDVNTWTPATINIQSDWDYKLLITVKMGNYQTGSVRLDDFKLVHGACSRTGKIDFENGPAGFGPPTGSDQWLLKLATDVFAPADRTYRTSLGHVIEADLSRITSSPSQAKIQSPLYPAVGDECLDFWFTKNGSTSSQLKVLLATYGPGGFSDAVTDASTLWSSSEASDWKRVHVDISTPYPYRIIFQASADAPQSDVFLIDDISFNLSPCPSAADCDFELGMCDYTAPPKGTFQDTYWKHVRGMYSSTIIPADHSTGTPQGNYMEIDFSSETAPSVDLINPQLPKTPAACLTFWYTGHGYGSLKVLTNTINSRTTSLMAKDFLPTATRDRKERAWRQVRLDFNSTVPYRLVFRALSSTSGFSDGQGGFSSYDVAIAVDDIVLVNDTCASLDAPKIDGHGPRHLDPKTALFGCDFEQATTCTFTNDKTNRNFNWQLFSFNSRHSAGTGLDFDHTKYNRYGHHIYMDASGQKYNATSRLISKTFTNDKFMCLDFHYSMYGRDVNRLNIYLSQGQTTQLYWTQAGDLGPRWHHAMVEIGQSPQPTQIIMEGVVGSSIQGDIGLDDIWVYDQICPAPNKCTFEDTQLCGFDQDNLDQIDWQVVPAAWPTGWGPQVDHTYGTSRGHYLLLDMTNTTYNDKGRISTRQYNASSAQCVSFWYHLTNSSSNSHTLLVILRDARGVERTLSALKGFFSDVWNVAFYPIHLMDLDKFQIVFEGQSLGPRGSIALDDISISQSACDEFISCGFETNSLCGWEPVSQTAGLAWEPDATSHYMKLDLTKLGNSDFHSSKVQSQVIPIQNLDSFCLSLHYSMYGANVGYLNISIEVDYPQRQSIPVFSVYGEQDEDTWKTVTIDKPPDVDLGTFRFVITGSTAESPDNSKPGYILVANIVFSMPSCKDVKKVEDEKYTCPSGQQISMIKVCDFIKDCPGNEDEQICGVCDFEKGYCEWSDVGEGPLEYREVTGVTLPISGQVSGHQLVVQRAGGDQVTYADLLLGPEIGPTPNQCKMKFDFYSVAVDQSGLGKFYVVMEENFEETVIWESSPNNNTRWQRAEVDIGGIHTRFKLHIRAIQSPFDYAMGLDDISYKDCTYPAKRSGPCPNSSDYKCRVTGVCIDKVTQLCDFTQDCGDSSDETPDICSSYLMDDFEESLGSWSQDGQDDFDWRRHSGRHDPAGPGPKRDHTEGVHNGHFLLFDGAGHSNGQAARLVSPEFLPSSGNCHVRFFYHMYGTVENDGLLNVNILSKTIGQTQNMLSYHPGRYDFWQRGSIAVTSTNNFQVVFEGKVINQSAIQIGLDDITFTPECKLKNPARYKTTTLRPSTTQYQAGRTNAPPIIRITTEGNVHPKSSIPNNTPKPGKEVGGPKSDQDSDGWKVAVGVVVPLVVILAVAGLLFYLKRSGKLRGIGANSNLSNPVFRYDGSGDGTIQIDQDTSTPRSVDDVFGESTKKKKERDVAIDNPMYAHRYEQDNDSDFNA